MATALRQNQNLLYIYDLPSHDYTSTQLAKVIKDRAGFDIDRMPQVRRDFNKPFYTAVIKVNDTAKFQEVCKALRYFDLNGKPCRALPFTNELLGSNVQRLSENNLFVRRVPKDVVGENFEKMFEKYGEIISCKVSLNQDHTSRGYGFVCFRDAEAATKALNETMNNDQTIGVKFAPRDKKDFRKVYNNIYVKNMPAAWGAEECKQFFNGYGHVSSLHFDKNDKGVFAFVCFGSEDPADREYGPRSAEKAVQEANDKEIDGLRLYVRPALKKGERERELMHETFKYKNSKKRCNLYVKGFPATTTHEDLETLFQRHGDIESLKLFPAKDNKSPFAFVCFKTPDQASTAKTQLNQHQIQNHPLYINHYEIKQYRDMNNEAQKDKQDFQRYQAENTGALSDIQNSEEIVNLLRILINQGILKKPNQQHGGRPGGYPQPHGGQGGHPGSRGPSNYGQQQQHQQQRQQPHGGMRQQQPMPQAPSQHMPAPMGMPQPAPQQAAPMGGMEKVASEYVAKTMPIINAIVPNNPAYQQIVGSNIFSFVQQMVGPELAPKITGMLIDLPIHEIRLYMQDYKILVERVKQARELLESQMQQH